MTDRYVLRDGLRYVVAVRIYTDFLGSGYRYYRNGCFVMRFWFKENAERFMRKLNQQEADRLLEGGE